MAFIPTPEDVRDRPRFASTAAAMLATTFSRRDGDLITTRGYHTADKGAATYRYETANSDTVDGVFILPGDGGTLSFSKTNVYDQAVSFDGTAGTGRHVLVDQSAVRTYQAGCYGDDSTEDSVYLQMAVNVASANSVEVIVEPGTYILGNQTDDASLGANGAAARLILLSNTILRGAGIGKSTLKSNKLLTLTNLTTDQRKTNCPMITSYGYRSTITFPLLTDIEITGITFQGNKAAGDDVLSDNAALEYCAAIAVTGVDGVTISDCEFHDWNGDGFLAESSHSIAAGTFGAVDTGTDSVTVTGHGLPTGTHLYLTGDDLPAGLAISTAYKAFAADANTLKFGVYVGTGSINDVSSVSGDTLTFFGNHTLVNTDKVFMWTPRPTQGHTLPTGLDDTTIYYVINKADTTLQLSASEGGAAVTLSDAGQGIMRIAKLVDITDAGTGTQSYLTVRPNRNIRFERNTGSGCLRGVCTFVTAKDSYMTNNLCTGQGVGLHLENGGATGAENAKPLQNVTVQNNRCSGMNGRPLWVATGGDDQFYGTKLLDNIFEDSTLTGFGSPLFIMAGNDSEVRGNTFRNITVDNHFFRLGGRGLKVEGNTFVGCSSAAYFFQILGAINATPCYTTIVGNKFIDCTSTGTQGTGATRFLYGETLGRYSEPEGLIVRDNLLSQISGFYYGIFTDHTGVIIRDNLLDAKSDGIRGIYNGTDSVNATIVGNKFTNWTDPIYNDDSMTTLIRDNIGSTLARATDVTSAQSELVRVVRDPDGTAMTRNLPFDVLFNAIHEDAIRVGLITTGTWFMGYKGQGSVTAGVTQDLAWAFGPFSPVVNGTLSNVKLFTADAVSSFFVTAGVWVDAAGSPGAMVAESAQVATQLNDWTTFPLGSEAITAGTNYWIGFVHDVAAMDVKYNLNATTDIKYVASVYSAGSLPDPYPGSETTISSRQYSIYAEYAF